MIMEPADPDELRRDMTEIISSLKDDMIRWCFEIEANRHHVGWCLLNKERKGGIYCSRKGIRSNIAGKNLQMTLRTLCLVKNVSEQKKSYIHK